MSVEWKPKWLFPNIDGGKKEEWEQGIICAESNGAKLQVHQSNTDEDGLHVCWQVIRQKRLLNCYGTVSCTEEELRVAWAKAKKLAEEFALCWSTYSN